MVKKKTETIFPVAYVGVELKYGRPTNRRGNSASSTVD